MRKIVLLMIVGLLIAFMAISCSSTSNVGETDEGTTKTGTETVTEKEGQQMAQMPKEDVSGKYMETNTAEFNDIYFDFDMYNIKDESKPTLRNLSSWLSDRNAKVIIEGHCDDRGTDEYNLGLGDRRANSTKQYLVAAGVSPNKIETISYGEERPQCSEKNESCWSKNRRAHFVILLPK